MSLQQHGNEARNAVLLQLIESITVPMQNTFDHTGDEAASREHERGVGREIRRDFETRSARPHTDRSALAIRGQ